MLDLLASLVPAIMQTDAGKAAFKTAFDIEELQAVNDGDFADFHTYVRESGVDISQLLDQ
jgi:hypothetical protein